MRPDGKGMTSVYFEKRKYDKAARGKTCEINLPLLRFGRAKVLLL